MIAREAFSISRTLEYLSEAELTKQIGYPRHLWPLAIVKELIDNALDHCEELGVPPAIAITVTDDCIAVQDNGAGIPPDTVVGMLDFDKRVSSREAYRSLTRGAQGNAGKCIIGIPYVWNEGSGPGRVTITARGVCHDITVSLDQLAQQPKIEYSQAEKVQTGTSVEVHLAELACILDADEKTRFVLFCQRYAALNPHLRLTLNIYGEAHTWERTAERCPKWTAAEPDPPAWYDIEAFERLAGACIAKDRQTGTDRPLRDFLRAFAGLKRSDTLKAVSDETGLVRCNLSALLNCNGFDRTKTERLLRAMQEHGKNPPPQKLGSIGRTHIEAFFRELGAYEGETKHKRAVGAVGNLPFVVEAAFAEVAAEEPVIITGCNFSPAVGRPVVRMLDSLLAQQMIGKDSAVAVLVHIATPSPTYLDRGKSVLDVQGELAEAITKAVVSVTAGYRKQRKAEERDARAAERWAQRRNRQRPEMQLCDAVRDVLPDAIENASGGGVVGFSARDCYYAARALIQEHTDKRLTQKYFDTIVNAWECENGLIDGLTRDPRGYLLEPHTERKIPLGTKAVDDYEIPLHLYDTILYFEKKGMESKCAYGQIAERYDCAIMASEGYAVRAAKALMEAAQRGRKMKVLCFHDADPAGYNIARTISRSTGAHRFKIEVIDAGLRLPEALDMGLAVETFDRKKALPNKLELTELEREYFSGEARTVWGKHGQKTHWVNCRRVELNALSADPHRFIAWVEATLQEHGVARKLVPPKKVIHSAARDQRDTMLKSAIRDAFHRHLDLDSLVATTAKTLGKQVDIRTLPEKLREWATKLEPISWRKHLESLVQGRVAQLADPITDMVTETLAGIATETPKCDDGGQPT